MASVTLISKPDCHLCDDARAMLTGIAGEFGLAVTELSIMDDADLMAEYAEEVPVVLIDGKVHTIWRVDPSRLRSALEAAS
ncbi:MAG: glutaredoxin family protein [Microbacteriaceae bacterium]|jgi:glutaredoxin|nr:glutaredoxin family protein [Microbacteriaceae bacterium]